MGPLIRPYFPFFPPSNCGAPPGGSDCGPLGPPPPALSSPWGPTAEGCPVALFPLSPVDPLPLIAPEGPEPPGPFPMLDPEEPLSIPDPILCRSFPVSMFPLPPFPASFVPPGELRSGVLPNNPLLGLPLLDPLPEEPCAISKAPDDGMSCGESEASP